MFFSLAKSSMPKAHMKSYHFSKIQIPYYNFVKKFVEKSSLKQKLRPLTPYKISW